MSKFPVKLTLFLMVWNALVLLNITKTVEQIFAEVVLTLVGDATQKNFVLSAYLVTT